MMKTAPVIELQQICKTYRIYSRSLDRVRETLFPALYSGLHRPFHALTGVDLTVLPGETIGIVGRNGSGKSTLLQIICGIVQASSGRLQVNGRISALLELGAGFNPEFSGRENVYLNGAILGLKREEIDGCFDDIAAFADIGEFIDQPVKTYSSGMYIRLAFAVAINVHPDILIVDEALSVGDTLFQAKCFAKFKEFQEQGVTILFVTHSMDLVTRYCSRACLLDRGRIILQGPPKEVVDRYNRLLVDVSRPGDHRQGDDGGAGQDSPETPREQVASHMRQSENRFRFNPHENRYGTGKAEIIDVGIFGEDGRAQQTLIQGKTYTFRMDVRFREQIRQPIYAFTIKDVKGFDISGTNTLYHEIDTGTVEAGQVVRVWFTQKIPLNPGGYLLSFGCAGFEEGEYVVYERRYDLMSFEVVADRGSVGIFDLDSTIVLGRTDMEHPDQGRGRRT